MMSIKKKSGLNRAVISALFICLFSISLQSQEPFLYKKAINTGLPSYDAGNYMIKNKIYGNNYYSLFCDNYDNYIYKYMIVRLDVTDLSSLESKSYKINFDTKNRLMESVKKDFVAILDYIIQVDFLYILAYKYIIKFQLKGDVYVVDKIVTIKDNISCSYISNLSNTNAIIAEHYKLDSLRPSVFVATVNLKNGNIEKITNAKIKGLMFATLSSNWWGFSDKYILLAGNIEYKVDIYNKQSLEIVDSIRYNKKEFDKNTNKIDSIIYKDKNTIVNIKNLDKSYYRIYNAYFINDTTILLAITKPNKEYVYTDLWQKRNGKWNLVIEDSKNINQVPNDTLICLNNNFLRVGVNSSSPRVFWNNFLVSKYNIYFNPMFFEGKTFKYFIDCYRKKIESDELKKNIDYQHSGIILYEMQTP